MQGVKKLKCISCGGEWFMERGAAQFNADQMFKFHKAPLHVGMLMHVLECVTCRTLNIPNYIYDGYSIDLQKMATEFVAAIEKGHKEVEKPEEK